MRTMRVIGIWLPAGLLPVLLLVLLLLAAAGPVRAGSPWGRPFEEGLRREGAARLSRGANDGMKVAEEMGRAAFLTAHQRRIRVWLWVGTVILALLFGAVTLLLLNRRLREKERRTAADLDSPEAFARALIRREPVVLAEIDAGGRESPSPELAGLVRALRRRAGALRIEDASGRELLLTGEDVCLASCGSENGLPEGIGFRFRQGRFLLETGRLRERLELDNPALGYKLRLVSGQLLVLCPGDRLLDGRGCCRLGFNLLPAGDPVAAGD